jgi:hypothetical protein
VTWLSGDPVDLSVDPPVDGGESDVPDTAALDDDTRDDP